ILEQQHQETAIADDDSLETPERSAETLETRDDLVARRIEDMRKGRCGERVVNVVQTRHAKSDLVLAARQLEAERNRVETVQLDVSRADCQRRTRVTTRRAPVVAEVTDVRRSVFVRRSAPDAVLRVRCVLQRRMRMPRIVDAEHHRPRTLPREVPDLRVVAVDDERGRPVERANGAAPALGDVLELAVTVELVAEEVPEADRTRVQALGDLGKRRLVDF